MILVDVLSRESDDAEQKTHSLIWAGDAIDELA
jgi:hypothetical protein